MLVNFAKQTILKKKKYHRGSAGRDFLTEKKYSNELHIFMLHTKQMIFVSCYRWHDF